MLVDVFCRLLQEFETSQYPCVSISRAELSTDDPAGDALACCTPPAREPVTEVQAVAALTGDAAPAAR